MKLLLVNLYPTATAARYMLSSYILKAYLDRYYRGNNSLSTDVLNFSNKTGVERICQNIAKHGPELVGFSCYSWNIEKIIIAIQQLRGMMQAVHILGGPEITSKRIESLPTRSSADYYVIGEGERSLLDLIYYHEKRSNGKQVNLPNGVASWQDKELCIGEERKAISNLDEIPSIYLSGTIEDRFYSLQQAFIETQRGCKFRCKYCVYPKFLSSVNYYSLQRVFDEIDFLVLEKGIKALRIFDAGFLSDLGRAKEIVRHLIKLKYDGVHLPWIYWEFNYHSADEEFMRLVALLRYRTGILNTQHFLPIDRPQHYSDLLKDYTAVNCVGIQSFCRGVLKAVRRPGISKEKLDAFMKMAKKHNIVMKLDIILGLPFETFDSYFEGLEFFLPYFKNTDHVLNIHRLQILPGSDLEAQCMEYGIIYSRNAPHTVFYTETFGEHELDYASRLTAILFRVLNSPLRQHFFEAKEQTGSTFYNLVTNIFDEVKISKDMEGIRLVRDRLVDDEYWNDEIFSDIPSEWITSLLQGYISKDG